MHLVFFLNIPLDWERLGPLWEVAAGQDDLKVTFITTRKFRWTTNPHPKIQSRIWNDVISFFFLGWLLRPDAFITVTESTARPHKRAHRMARYANFLGIRTVTIQHGYECVGINYADEIHTSEIAIASNNILIWQSINQLPTVFSEKIAERCIESAYVVPRSESVQLAELRNVLNKKGMKHWLLVTENLHWHRYTDSYRDDFMKGLEEAAQVHQETGFIVKHHPAGRFLEKMPKEDMPSNISLLSDIWPENVSIANCLECVDGLITTPSTTVLDSVALGKPLVVVRNDLPGKWPYEPLFTITAPKDWPDAVSRLINSTNDSKEQAEKFVQENEIQFSNSQEVLDQLVLIAKAR